MKAANEIHVIIDGNNLIHRDAELLRLSRTDFDAARRRLVARVAGAARENERTTVIFDGRSDGPSPDFGEEGVEVIFSPSHLSADTVIERMVLEARDPARLLVVTSDRGERDAAEAAGTPTVSCISFLEQLADRERLLAARVRSSRKAPRSTLGDYFPR